MAPTPARAPGTTAPTARNFEATATPHCRPAGPSALQATIENVMPRNLLRLTPLVTSACFVGVKQFAFAIAPPGRPAEGADRAISLFRAGAARPAAAQGTAGVA